MNREAKPQIRLLENGDHAVTWRLFFMVINVYRILEAEYAVNRAAYDLSLETGIGLDSPITHRLLEVSASTPGAKIPVADAKPETSAPQTEKVG